MTKLTAQFEKALIFATRLHADQTRKGDGTPYIGHLLSVTGLVIEDGGSEEEAIAALLHDAIEDQGGEATRRTILQQFGAEVTRIVEGCSEPFSSPKPPWKTRKLQYIAQLQNADESICRVSLADKLHNMRSLVKQYQQQGEVIWQAFHGGKEGTIWFYNELLDCYRSKINSPMLAELEKIITKTN